MRLVFNMIGSQKTIAIADAVFGDSAAVTFRVEKAGPIQTLTTFTVTEPGTLDVNGNDVAGDVDVDAMVTHRLPLAETGRGFRLVQDGGEAMKVIVRPQE